MGRICIPIVETTTKEAIKAVKKAGPLADLIEIRADYLNDVELVPLIKNRKKPFIITNRRKEEGGRYRDDEEERFGILREAVELGVEYVDMEIRSKGSLVRDLVANKKKTKMILSFHNFQGTPSGRELKRLWSHMDRSGADIVKIVTFARSRGDNLLILSLIPFVREKGKRIVAFCMGEKGRMSRVFAPLMGAEWTYTSLEKNRTSAPGQLTAGEMKDIWERLK